MMKNLIHRALATRLAVAAACTALILMAVVFWVELKTLDLQVQGQAAAAVERLRWSIMDELDAEGLGDHSRIQRTLEKALSIKKRPTQSSFAYVRILDPVFREVAQVSNPAYEHISPATHDSKSSVIDKERQEPALWNRISRANGAFVIQLGKALENSKGKPAAYVEGAYVISPAYIKKVRYDAAVSALLAAGIVFMTTLILYPTIIRLVRKITGLSADLVHANLEILSVLGGAISKRDSETGIHNCRVTIYAIRIAQEMGLKDEEMRSLIKGAFLHDIGKIGVRDNVLFKPGSLTPEEFEETKQHVRHGLDIVNRSTWLVDAALIVGGHHEKYDGSGYLDGRKCHEIPKVARIFAVADVFDALISKRPYKETMECAEAVEIISRDRGRHFDPEILDVFLKIAPEIYATYAAMDNAKLKTSMIELGSGYFMPDFGKVFERTESFSMKESWKNANQLK